MNDLINQSHAINNNIIFDPYYINLTTAKDINDVGKNKFSKYFGALSIYKKLLLTLLKNKIDLSYITLSPHGIAFYKDSLIILILRLFRIKRVIHLHGKGINAIIKTNRFKKSLYAFIFKNAKVIHLSPKLYFDIKEIVKKENIYFLANGIGHKEVIKKESVNNRLLYLSNLQETKGSFILLQAARILKERNVDFNVDFVGKWHKDKSFKEKFISYIRENGLSNIVKHHGAKYGKDKETFLENSSVFVLPTFYKNECFPISILEAMSYGLIVISTYEGAISEIVDNNKTGLLLDKVDPIELANKIEFLLKSKDKMLEMGVQAQSKFKLCYTKEIFENKLIQIISDILKTYE